MTLGEIKRRARTLEQQRRLSPSARDLDEVMNEDVVEVTDDLAARTEGWWLNQVTDVTADTFLYCAPLHYRIKTVDFLLSSDAESWRALRLVSRYDAERRLGASFSRDTSGSADPPTHAILDGVNQVTLWPTPSASRTGALKIGGFAKPGSAWSYDGDGVAEALADSQECPLPEWMHDAIPYGVAAMRLSRYAMTEENERLYQRMRELGREYGAAYERAVGENEGKVIRFGYLSATWGIRNAYQVVG